MTVYVVGSVNIDLIAYADKFPESGETLIGNGFERHLGGKGANQSVAAALAGARTNLIGAVGHDDLGTTLREALRGFGVGVQDIATARSPTGVACITVSGGDNRIIVVPGANAHLDPAQLTAVPLAPGDVCLMQLEIPIAAVKAALERARACRATTLLNPAPALPVARSLLPLADIVVVNETECAVFAGRAFALTEIKGAISGLATGMGLSREQILIVTLGSSGVVALMGEEVLLLPGHAVDAVDTTGAGDCFCGYLAAGIDLGLALRETLAVANAAAALSVQNKGAAESFPDRAQVGRFLARLG
jgi:ribokinase